MREVHEVPAIAPLRRDAHKGDRGRLLVVAGSLRMSGAARLAGWGALRGGAGLVTIATPDVVQPIVAAESPCLMTLPLPSRQGVLAASGAARAREFADRVDAVAVGPGLTTDAAPFLRRFLRGMKVPVVLDADALNVLAGDRSLVEGLEGPRVLTPHPGEAARLLGEPVGPEAAARREAAGALAERYHAVAVLKGASTVVCDGDRIHVCGHGNPGLASGGTGDVLTGVVGARLAAGADPFAAAVQAVHAHARAGDLAAAATGERSMIATDLVANLAVAIGELVRRTTKRNGKRGKEGGSRRRGNP
jgi:hydroxyethylthiazole kinase-like uncharacterized protein yjeF